MSSSAPVKVSCTIENAGKRVRESKKHVAWRFQYDPAGSGGNGGDGAIHTVEFYHSIMSGKRRLFMDGRLVFEKTDKVELLRESLSMRSREGRLDHTWQDGSHRLRLHIVEKSDGFLYDIIIDNTRWSRGMKWSRANTGPGNPYHGAGT